MRREVSSRHLSHDCLAWKGLSLRELSLGAMIVTPMIALVMGVVGLFIGFPVALLGLGLVVGFIFSVTHLPSILMRIKVDKPPGALGKYLCLKAVKLGLRKSPWVFHHGDWRRSKSLGVEDV